MMGTDFAVYAAKPIALTVHHLQYISNTIKEKCMHASSGINIKRGSLVVAFRGFCGKEAIHTLT